MSKGKIEAGVYITVDQRSYDKALQLQIGDVDAQGYGTGYRIAGRGTF